MQERKAELERFKKEIDLVNFIASYGYKIIPEKSTKKHVVLRKQDERLVVSKHEVTGHYMYFNANNDEDKGTIIDFVQNREATNFGEIRKKLREYISGGLSVEAENYQGIKRKGYDLDSVRQTFSRYTPITKNPYLKNRGINEAIINSTRFKGTIYTDGKYNNVVFPHKQQGQVCGFEVKNKSFNGFSPKGKKLIYSSKIFSQDEAWAFCESGIDLLSFFQVHQFENTVHSSCAGNFGNDLLNELEQQLNDKKHIKLLIAAFDNDEDGNKYTQRLKTLAEKCGLEFKDIRPALNFKDWNEALQN